MKTNFEKWKKELTPEMLCEALIADCDCTFTGGGRCPAWEYCRQKGAWELGCEATFFAWANAPAKEENNA